MRILILACLIANLTPAAVRLHSTPQKFRTFYTKDSPDVPAALKALPTSSTPSTTADDGVTWNGTGKGLTRTSLKEIPSRRMQFFSGKRYLPDDKVEAILAHKNGAWVRTATGVAHIEFRSLTLAQKAALFEQRIAARHNRHGLVADSHLSTPGDLSTSQTVPTDNDGLWTSIYSTAACFRYAVEPTPANLDRARQATDAILFLEQVTNRPGFPARSFVTANEKPSSDGMWHWTADGKYRFKGDTSSDELVGHFFAFAVAWDLLPDPALKARIAATTSRIMDHILDHDLAMTDVTGFPTFWGRWSEDYFASIRGRSDSPLNAAEILSFLKAAHHITGNPRYLREYNRLALGRGYAALAGKVIELREELNYSDEELAFLPLYLLFRYEKDPKLLALYRTALDGWWQNAQREANPLWTMIFMLGRPGAKHNLNAAVETLYRMPIDMITWNVTNSQREDVPLAKEIDRHQHPQSTRLLPPDERPVMRWNANPFQVDGGNNGSSENDGAHFLLPYWLGRYHKLLIGE